MNTSTLPTEKQPHEIPRALETSEIPRVVDDYTQKIAGKAIADGHADLIAFGRPFISNPDLVERFRNDWFKNGWTLAAPAQSRMAGP